MKQIEYLFKTYGDNLVTRYCFFKKLRQVPNGILIIQVKKETIGSRIEDKSNRPQDIVRPIDSETGIPFEVETFGSIYVETVNGRRTNYFPVDALEYYETYFN
jgi:hypothetical protein